MVVHCPRRPLSKSGPTNPDRRSNALPQAEQPLSLGIDAIRRGDEPIEGKTPLAFENEDS